MKMSTVCVIVTKKPCIFLKFITHSELTTGGWSRGTFLEILKKLFCFKDIQWDCAQGTGVGLKKWVLISQLYS